MNGHSPITYATQETTDQMELMAKVEEFVKENVDKSKVTLAQFEDMCLEIYRKINNTWE